MVPFLDRNPGAKHGEIGLTAVSTVNHVWAETVLELSLSDHFASLHKVKATGTGSETVTSQQCAMEHKITAIKCVQLGLLGCEASADCFFAAQLLRRINYRNFAVLGQNWQRPDLSFSDQTFLST